MDLGQDDYPETVADAYELLNRTTNEITATGRGNQRNRGGRRVQFVQQRGDNDDWCREQMGA